MYADSAALTVDVETPSGESLSIDDPALIDRLRAGIDSAHILKLIRSDRALTDCRPASLFSSQTAQQLGRELGMAVDQRRFRANIYADLASGEGFAEDALVGRRVRVGPDAVVSVLKRDARCKMITLDPDTGVATPAILKQVLHAHEGKAGVYAAVLVEGLIRRGDSIDVVD